MWQTLKQYWPFRVFTAHPLPPQKYSYSYEASVSLWADRYDSIQLLLLAEKALQERIGWLFQLAYHAYLHQKHYQTAHYTYRGPVQGNEPIIATHHFSKSLRLLLAAHLYHKIGAYCEERGFDEPADIYYAQTPLYVGNLSLPPLTNQQQLLSASKTFLQQLDEIITTKELLVPHTQNTNPTTGQLDIALNAIPSANAIPYTLEADLDTIIKEGVDTGRNQLSRHFVLPAFTKSRLQINIEDDIKCFESDFAPLKIINAKSHPNTIAQIENVMMDLKAALADSMMQRDDRLLIKKLREIHKLSASYGCTYWLLFGGIDTFYFAKFRTELNKYLSKCDNEQMSIRVGFSINEMDIQVNDLKDKAQETLKKTVEDTSKAAHKRTANAYESSEVLQQLRREIEQSQREREQAQREREQAQREREQAQQQREQAQQQIEQAQRDREAWLEKLNGSKRKRKATANSFTTIKQQLEDDENNLATIVETIGENLNCPISQDTMQTPVVTPPGHSYEEEAITEWLHYYNQTDPQTREILPSAALYPNRNLQGVISSYTDLRSVHESFTQILRNWPNPELSDSSDDERTEPAHDSQTPTEEVITLDDHSPENSFRQSL